MPRKRSATTSRRQEDDNRRVRLDLVRPIDHLPTPGVTYAHPDCYASGFAGCSQEISAEHFMSESVLRLLLRDERGVFVRGFEWAPPGKWIRPETLTAKVL
jgi:hypothetical protein